MLQTGLTIHFQKMVPLAVENLIKKSFGNNRENVMKKMTINFYKYQGTGNDFIIIDNRDNTVKLTEQEIKKACERRKGIGADGLMLLNTLDGYDFEMKYYNSDGGESSMCGNGGRCMVKFAMDLGLIKMQYKFLAVDGEHEAYQDKSGWIFLKMQNVDVVEKKHGDFILNTGSPHYIRPVSDIWGLDFIKAAKEIRYNEAYAKEGINVNFVEDSGDKLYVRTYERGVEDETLSCGTGVTAAALVFAHNALGFNRVK